MATVSRSKTRRRRKQKVPHLTGLHVRDAQLVLRHRGFYDPALEDTPDEGPRIDIRYVKNFAPYGTVVGQQPSKGQIVDSDSVVHMTVSMESLLDYLPAIYRRHDVDGSNFIRDFLWIFQDIFHSIESKIDRMSTYFDVFESPEEFLPWLASWVAFALDGEWEEAERRLFLKKAVELYRIRGTVRGLTTMLKMYTGVEAVIIENAWPLEGFQIGVASTIGIDSAILPPIDRAHCFIVEVPLDVDVLEDDEIIKIHQIINQERPAHTTYYLRFTGTATSSSTWAGPVIGQYMVSSATVLRGEDAVDEAASAARMTGETGAVTAEAKSARRAERRKAKSAVAEELTRKGRRKSRKDEDIPPAEEAPPAEEPAAAETAPAKDTPARSSRRSKKATEEAVVESAKATDEEETPRKRRRRRKTEEADAGAEETGKKSAAERRAERRAAREARKAAEAAEGGAATEEADGDAKAKEDDGKKETAAERRARRKAEREARQAAAGTADKPEKAKDKKAKPSEAADGDGESAAERLERRRKERAARRAKAAAAEEGEESSEKAEKPAKKRRSRAKSGDAEERARQRRSRRKKKSDESDE